MIARTKQRYGRVGVMILSAGLFLGACTAPPSVGPFADSTLALRSAVQTGGKVVEDSVRSSGLSSAADQADKIKAAWKKRVDVMNAAVAYAQGLQAIVGAAEQSAQTVNTIADGVAGIASAAGIALPPAEMVAVAVEGAGYIYRQINNVRAAKSLEASLTAADAALQEIARVLAADTKDLDDLLKVVEAQTVSGIERADVYSNLDLRMNGLQEAIGAINLSRAGPDDITRLGQLNGVADSVRSALGKRDVEVADARAKIREERVLIDAMGDAVMAWANAHSQLVTALKTRTPVSTESLINATVELRSIIRKVRAL